jgi:hypothetical protein
VAADPAASQIVTDRPDFTESTATVPQGRVQIEAGYTLLKIDDATEHQIGEGLLRLGIIPGLEARVGIPTFHSQSIETDGLIELEREESGFGDASVGMKLGLYESGMSEGLPSLSLLLGSSIPLGDDDFGADGWEPEAILALGWSLAPRLDLGVNAGYAQRVDDDLVGDDDRFNETWGSIALGFPIAGSLAGFGEYFAIRPDEGIDQDFIDAGVTYLLSETFQLDARVGKGLGDTDDAVFFGVGLAKLF